VKIAADQLCQSGNTKRDAGAFPSRLNCDKQREGQPGLYVFTSERMAPLQGRDGQRPPDRWARAPRLAPIVGQLVAARVAQHMAADLWGAGWGSFI